MSTTATAGGVLVTGGSAGLGLEMARGYRAQGRPVLVCGRTAATLEQAERDIPGLATVVADVGTSEGRQAIWQAIDAGRAGELEILVNNAALTRAHDYTSPYTLDLDRASPEILTNFTAPIELTREFLRRKRRHDGSWASATLVMVGTPGALFPLEAQPLYCATKAGLHMFTLTLRRQLRGTAVTVIEVFPPGLPTGLTRDIETSSDNGGPEVVAQVAGRIIDDIAAGVEVSLPHEQSERLYHAMPQLAPEFVDRVNAGVRRRVGWDAADTH
jgi:uncharacterized oxidoreductase